MANTTYNTVTVGDTATAIIAANSFTRGWVIYNAGATTVFYGPDASITAGNCPGLLPGGTILSSDFSNWRGFIYGIVASGTEDVRFWQWGE